MNNLSGFDSLVSEVPLIDSSPLKLRGAGGGQPTIKRDLRLNAPPKGKENIKDVLKRALAGKMEVDGDEEVDLEKLRAMEQKMLEESENV
jgi:hypothetical protein